MSRRSLGAQWNQLSDKEKQEFVDLFRTLLTNTYADRVETYSGEGAIPQRADGKRNMRGAHQGLVREDGIPDYRLMNKGNGGTYV